MPFSIHARYVRPALTLVGVAILFLVALDVAYGQPGRPRVPPFGPRLPNDPIRGPAIPGMPNTQDVYTCDNCNKEVGRGPFPPTLFRCPHCGALFVNGGIPGAGAAPGANPLDRQRMRPVPQAGPARPVTQPGAPPPPAPVAAQNGAQTPPPRVPMPAPFVPPDKPSVLSSTFLTTLAVEGLLFGGLAIVGIVMMATGRPNQRARAERGAD